MLTAVLHGLRAQRKQFVLITTDVKGAFNHTPTAGTRGLAFHINFTSLMTSTPTLKNAYGAFCSP